MFESGNSPFVRVLRFSKLDVAFYPVCNCNTLIILSHTKVVRKREEGKGKGEGGREGGNGERKEGRVGMGRGHKAE